MRRKILLALIILIIGFVALFIFIESRKKPVISNKLSERSKEFLEGRKNIANSNLSNLNLNGPVGEDTRNKRVGRDECFSFVIPYRITIGKYEDQEGSECYTRLSFDSPKGAIVAYKFTKPISSWEDIPAVIQRRRDTDEYFPEELKALGGKKFIMFKGKTDLYEKNAFYFTPEYFFVFNLITKTNENLDKEMDAMLSTLEVE